MSAHWTIQKKLVRTSLSVLVPAFVAVTLAVVALNVFLSGRSQAAAVSRIEASLTAKGRILTSNNAQALAGMAEGNAFIQIKDLVASTVKDDPDVVYGLFLPADSSNPCELSDESDSATEDGALAKVGAVKDQSGISWARSSRSLSTRRTGSGHQERLEFSAPVGSAEAPTGWILYKLSTESMSEAIQSAKSSARNSLLGVVVLLLALGAGALAFSLAKFKSEAEKLSKPVRELASAADIIRGGDYKTRVSVDSDDEIGALASTFETMRQTVQSYTEHLEELVAEKMRQVRDILDNVDQGLLVVNFDGTLSPEHSRAASAVLGVDDLEDIQGAFQLSSSQQQDFMSWLRLVRQRHAAMRWDKLTKIAPVQDLEIVGPENQTRYVRVRYQRMYDKNRQIEKIMVLAQDETENRRIERIVADEKERHENEVKTILGLVNNLPEVIRDFMHDVRKRIVDTEFLCRSMLDRSVAACEHDPPRAALAPSSEEISRVFRDFHTIKGNAGTYGFDQLAKFAHQGEDLLEELRRPITMRTPSILRAILDKLGEISKALEEILATEKKLLSGGGCGDAFLQISERKVEHVRRLALALRTAVHKGVESDAVRTLAEACEHMRDVPLSKLAEKYRGMVQRLADRMGKQIHLEVVPNHLAVGPSFFSPLDEALAHMFRNAADHGIELPEARAASGKPECGTIHLEVRPDEEKVVVTVSDDGAGINADAVAAKAMERGVISASEAVTMSAEEKILLIFESGLSTASFITDVSGRGVGMSAVRESIEALGGTISITSVVGRGTQIVLQIPQRGS
jgi:two-component system chemotaxis sensor kinase CheA